MSAGRIVLVTVFHVAALVWAAPTAAQELPARLTLEEAIRIAEIYSPAHRQALNSLESAEISERRSFRNTFWPNINTSLNFRGSAFRNYTAEDFDGSPLENPLVREGRSSSSSQGINVDMTLFSGPRLMQYRQARISRERAITSAETNMFGVRADVTRRFFAAIQAEDGIEVERRLVERARNNVEVVERRFAAGMIELEDVLGARLEATNREFELQRALGEARKARLDLLQAMGVEEERPFELVGELPEPFDPALLDVEELVRIARTESPRIRQADANLRASEASARAARAGRWPTLAASASYGRSRTTPDHSSLLELNPKNSDYNVSLRLSVPIPLLNFDQNAGIALADIARQNEEESLRRERMALENEVRARVIDLRTAYGNIAMAEQRLELNRQRVELLEERFRAGLRIEFSRLEQAWDQAAQAERGVFSARIAFQNTLLSLEQLLGRQIRP